MIEPPMSKLLERTDDRFTLCIFVAKRARQLLDGAKCLADTSPGKPVTIATKEINEGKIKFTRNKKTSQR